MALLSPKEAAERLRVDVYTVYGWLRSGKLQGIKLGGRRSWSVDESDLDAFIADSKVGHKVGRQNHKVRPKVATNHRGPKRRKLVNANWRKRYERTA